MNVTLNELMSNPHRPLSLFNYTHLSFHFQTGRACPSFGTKKG